MEDPIVNGELPILIGLIAWRPTPDIGCIACFTDPRAPVVAEGAKDPLDNLPGISVVTDMNADVESAAPAPH
jgi:hypothetical protein